MEYLSAIKLNKGLPENTYLNSLAPVRYLMQNELTFDRPVTFLLVRMVLENRLYLKLLPCAADLIPRVDRGTFAFQRRIHILVLESI